MNSGRLLDLLFSIPAFVAAFTIHEFAHAWTANRLGDDTPRRMGRLTLDPLVHLDPFGCLMLVMAALSGVPLLGWAKPVPFQPRNLQNPRIGSILVAIAGPISNVLQTIVWVAALWIFRLVADHNGLDWKAEMSLPWAIVMIMIIGITLNINLAAFNMIPIPPLDGHYVLEGLGPPFITDIYNSIRPYSFLLLFLLIQTPFFNQILAPFDMLAMRIIYLALGAPSY
ncbi:MAG: site-2 protease family protein [Abitibacteriaceae bacterium]|nr:site-2 protease family protein [Abditibacteriaceae bacterium]MBV9864514.1 site-2 protease family protein [Abditibacteriaceae bacterium]